jgi:two-component system sensor histidine kinase VicK
MSAVMLSDYSEIRQNESIMELINLVNTTSKRSVEMIQDLVNKEFLETSETELVKQRVDMVLKIREIIDQYKQSPGVIKQKLDLITSPDSLYIAIDVSKFMQALNNLLSNALKFTPDDGNISLV